MAYEIIVESEAELDFDEAYTNYLLISKLLGQSFGRIVQTALNFVSENPSISFQKFNDLERFNIKQFPFSIYYLKNDRTRTISVIGILHFKRDIDAILSKRQSY